MTDQPLAWALPPEPARIVRTVYDPDGYAWIRLVDAGPDGVDAWVSPERFGDDVDLHRCTWGQLLLRSGRLTRRPVYTPDDGGSDG